MTLDDFREMGRLRFKLPLYQKKKEAALMLSAEQLQKHERPYIAISGGKDSTAMAFIVDEAARLVGKDFELWCHVSDASFPGTVETVREIARRINRKLVLYESPISAFEAVKNKKKAAFGKSGFFFDSIREYAADKDLAFVGVRAFESKRRMKAAKAHGFVYKSGEMGDVTVCAPLTWFRIEDVAAALYEYDAPIHPIYSKMAVDGGKNINDEERWIRLNYVTSKDLLHKGTAVFLRLNYPELYNKLRTAFPEVAQYV